jgi:hypothetical protein
MADQPGPLACSPAQANAINLEDLMNFNMRRSALYLSFWGLFAAALAGTALGLCSQLYYLSYVSLANPALRLWLGPIGGAIGGMLLAFAVGFFVSKLSKLSGESSNKLAGWALLAASALSLPFWYAISEADAYWLPLVLWAGFVAALYPFMRTGRQTSLDNGQASKLQKLVPLMAGLVVIGGLLLRLSGVSYGLPDLIPHSDTPKQIMLLHYFMQGELMVPDYYPVGHIYLYAALLKIFWLLAPLPGQAPLLAIGSVANSSNLIIAARTLSVFLASGIPLLGYLAARRLWGVWAGLAAALFLALDPVHMNYARQVMGDVPQTFWVMFSFYFAVRMLQEKRWWDCLLAGLFAGFAVSAKLYGGYIITAGFAAWLLASPRQVWMPLLIIAGLALGVVINTPYIFIDPAFWYHNVTYLSAEQYGVGYDRTIWEGFLYSFTGLIHRFHLPWLLTALAGLVILIKRHRKEDLLFLVPALLSIIFIYGFRLRYLRQWDFVNLTIYYNMAVAVFVCVFLGWAWKRKIWNQAVPILAGLFLVFQTWTAVSDAWIARQDDTRMAAKSWLACLTRPGERVPAQMGFSGAFTDWCVNHGPCIESIEVSKQLTNGHIPDQANALVLENGWLDPEVPSQHLKPLLNIKVHHSHWEHPREALYRPDSFGYTGKVALPLFRANPKHYAFWNTAFGRSLPAELINLPYRREMDAFSQEQSVGWVGYMALGKGQGRLRVGPGLSLAIKSTPDQPDAGMAYLLRTPLPLLPRTYRVGLEWTKDQAVWVGVFPRPQGMLPMLLRMKAWSRLKPLAQRAWEDDGSLEAGLIWAAALAKDGKKVQAATVLAEIKKREPGFIAKYGELGKGTETEVLARLSALTGLGTAVLNWRRAVWPGEDGWWGDTRNAALDPAQDEKLDRKHHIWLTHEFLPGFLSLRARLGWERPDQAGKATLRIVAHRPGLLVADVMRIELEPGQTEVEFAAQLAKGPVRLEAILESPTPAGPRIQRLELEPDFTAEFAWRWQAIQEQLGDLLD